MARRGRRRRRRSVGGRPNLSRDRDRRGGGRDLRPMRRLRRRTSPSHSRRSLRASRRSWTRPRSRHTPSARASYPAAVRPRLKQPPAAGILFDVDTGEVLWARNPAAERPIASLTKMMTALLIAERHRPAERVLISAKAPGVEGSRIGVLKAGSKVPLGGLFLGLLLASGNDAAVALAEHDAGTVVRLRQAHEPPRRGDGPRVHPVRRARRAAGQGQRLMRVRPRGAGARRPGKQVGRVGDSAALGRGALPGQGRNPEPGQQPLLRPARESPGPGTPGSRG